jgi:5-methylcytosine-specific restriction endonuclease McrA
VQTALAECPICQSTFDPALPQQRYCSAPCRRRALNERMRARRHGGILELQCPMCPTTFAPFGRKRYCSRVCQLRGRNETTQVARRGPRACAECGDIFIVGYPDKRRDYCSPECRIQRVARINSAAKDARERSGGAATIELFDPVAILERDGWWCQRCGRETPKELRATNDQRAPQVDHVIPLSRGGAHTPENSQCLCRACNLEKAGRERAGKPAERAMAG